MKRLRHWLMSAAVFGAAPAAHATTVTFDTASAKAVVGALRNGQLTIDQATAIARMAGNQGITRELKGFGIAASDERFAKALHAAAHGLPAGDAVEESYALDSVKDHLDTIGNLIAAIDHDPDRFQGAIERRIALFAPRNADIHLHGYVVAGGDGGGYSFGGTDFYLNTGMVQDVVLAQAVANHEMYHAVQGAFAARRGVASGDADQSTCTATARLLDDLYEEGTAAYVEDVSLVDQSRSEIGLRKQTDMKDGLKHRAWSASLLEMSVDSLTVTPRMPYDQVYAVGFYGHGVLYTIGYVMARSIVADQGAAGLVKLLTQPSYSFVLAYAKLPDYGKDADHPVLGKNTIAAANALAGSCKAADARQGARREP